MANSKAKPSAFDGLIAARKSAPPAEAVQETAATLELKRPGPGRPRGKSSDPEYQAATGYVRRETYLRVQMALLPEKREFSDLLQELLAQWLAQNGGAE